MIGDNAVRYRGTIGGSLANNDPTACYPAAALALDATIKTDKRWIKADDFFQGMFTTALEPGELITLGGVSDRREIRLREVPQPGLALRHGRRVRGEERRLACAWRSPAPARAACSATPRSNRRLSANWSPAALDGIKTPADGLNSDIHGSAEYRAHLIGVMAKRAVAAAG